ncbi:Uu.00g128360.m01.CDS01 [Anthostomella pinea]|uniref:Uu.00g128360.m01.CDS01 n=1 Tax=Anthostomella pinea TaxID=933095 RepID=A0AAI8VIC4_9PEZI|nr:Uu.00g128360.m01.CDS01 [Anthostomella pinea]
MASTRANALPNFILTPQQQNLLFRALTSNQPANNGNEFNNELSLSPGSLTTSPVAQIQKNNTGADTSNAIQESPYLDYDYDLGPDTSFDFDFSNDGQAKMIGDLPGSSSSKEGSQDGSKVSSPDNDGSDKRSHPDEDDEEEEEGGGKRREGEGKVSKKPGRKPLTNEPTSKRKAQNRAAQRAFRERKEKHLKDLETKVEELEKASAARNNENSQLRSQVEKMTAELEQYKKKLSIVNTNSRSASGGVPRNNSFGTAAVQNINDVNFQFEFPKFGVLPGPAASGTGGAKRASAYPSPSSGNSPNGQTSPMEKSKDQAIPSSTETRENSDLPKSSGIYSNSSPYDNAYNASGSRTSLDSAHYSANGANAGSPSSSTNSHTGPSSSCGTSPEPFSQSPLGFKPLETLTTIGEEQPGLTSLATSSFGNLGNSSLGNIDFSNFDWLSQQNGGQFDPQLFGDYREPQDNILANTNFDDSFFNDAFEMDFTTPFNVPNTSATKPKKDICAEIDAAKEADDTVVAAPKGVYAPNGKLLTCGNIWEQLQTCPKVQSGDLDLDGLCSDLQKKARCGGSGAVVDESDFRNIMFKYLGPDLKCPDSVQ